MSPGPPSPGQATPTNATSDTYMPEGGSPDRATDGTIAIDPVLSVDGPTLSIPASIRAASDADAPDIAATDGATPDRYTTTLDTPVLDNTASEEAAFDLPQHLSKEDYDDLRAQIKGAIAYNKAHNPAATKQSVFDFFGVKRRKGYKMLQASPARPTPDQPKKERRGRRVKILKADVRCMEEILKTEKVNSQGGSWQELASRAGLVGERHVHSHTLRNMMQDLEYHRCTTCKNNWLAPHIKAGRKVFAQQYLDWTVPDWKFVRFSDKIHFGFGPNGKVRVLKRHGERSCVDCMQEGAEPLPREKKPDKLLHAWAMVGWNYKSPLYWYDTKFPDGRMNQQEYIDLILTAIVRPMLQNGEVFLLEEEHDETHGPKDNGNQVRKWKEQNGLNYYINAPKSPDLIVIDDAFRSLSQFLSKQDVSDWTEETLKERLEDCWDNHVPQSHINRKVEGMRSRTQEVLDADGEMIGL